MQNKTSVVLIEFHSIVYTCTVYIHTAAVIQERARAWSLCQTQTSCHKCWTRLYIYT